MKPSLEEFMKCGASWHGEHKGIRYKLSWHGYSESNPQGIWCWYIHLRDEQFEPEDWDKLRLHKEDKMFGESWHRHYRYDDFPYIEPHGGWTWGNMKTYLGKRDGKEHEWLEVGCDYNHFWDHESGYWQDKTTVEEDVKHSIDLLVKMFPNMRPSCKYSGIYDVRENFYESAGGFLVHKSQFKKLVKDLPEWESWHPKEDDPIWNTIAA